MTLLSSRPARAARALPELWLTLGLGLTLVALRGVIPPAWNGSLGWVVHPYQVFATLVAAVIFTLPGAMLFRLLRVGGSWWTRLPAYFAAAVGVWAVPGLIVALAAKFEVQSLLGGGIALTVLIALAAFVRELRDPSEGDEALGEGRVDPGESVHPSLAIGGLIAVVAVIWISFFVAPVTLDDNLQLSFVQDNLVVPQINALEPIFGSGLRPNTRGSLTTWPLNLTVIASLSGLAAQQTYWLLRTPLVALDLLGVYALTLRLFGRRRQAVFTMVFYCLLAVTFTRGQDAIGFSLFGRTAQDKFVARYTLLPVTLAWCLAYLKGSGRRAYLLSGVTAFGLASTHTIGVILLGIPLSGLGILHILNHVQGPGPSLVRRIRVGHERGEEGGGGLWAWVKGFIRLNWPTVRPFAFLALLVLGGLVVPLVQRSSPDAPPVAYSLTDTGDALLATRVGLVINNFRLLIADSLGPQAYVVHPRIFLSPVILLPILGLPLMLRRGRKGFASELIAGTIVLDLFLLLVPPVVQFIGGRTTPWLLYRFSWPLSLLGPIAIAWGGWASLGRLGRRVPETARFALPSVALLIAIVTSASQVRAGIIYLWEIRTDPVLSRCRTLQPLLRHLPDLVGAGAVVLSTPEMDICLPANAANAYPIEYFLNSTLNRFPQSRLSEALRRRADALAFASAQVVDRNFMDLLTRWNVELILLPGDHPLESQLRHLPQLFKLELRQGRYSIYRVSTDAGTDVSSELKVEDRWDKVHWPGDDPLVAANTRWVEGRWEEAAAAFQALTERGDDDLRFLALIGLGRTHLSAGRLDESIAAFAAASEIGPGDTQAWILLGNAHWLRGNWSQAADAYERAVGRTPWHPVAWLMLGDAYRFLGRDDEARSAYQRAVAADSAPGSSIYYRDLGSIYLAVNWVEDAISAFRRSLSLRETNLAYFGLSQAYRKSGDLDAAIEVARRAHRFEFWSDLPYVSLGWLELDRGNTTAALQHFRRAVARNPRSIANRFLAVATDSTLGGAAALEQIEALIGYRLGFAEPVLVAARLQRALGQIDDALDSSQWAWQWDPQSWQSAVLIGNLQQSLGRDDQAAGYYREAIAVTPSRPVAYVGLSNLAQRRGDWGTAFGWGWTARIAAPHASAAVVTLGDLYAARGEVNRALATYEFAIQVDPHAAGPHVALGDFFRRDLGQFDRAIRAYQAALAVHPTDTAAYRGLSSAYLGLGELPLAEEAINRAVELHPGEGANLVAQAELLLKQGETDMAVERLERAVRLDPGFRSAYASLADAYLRLGRMEEAETVYRQLVASRSRSPEGYLGLGGVYERRGDWAGASATYRQALAQLDPGVSGRVSSALADLQRRQGQFDQALASYQDAVRQQPTLIQGYVALSQFYTQRGDPASALGVLRQGLSLHPASPELNEALARVEASRGNVEGAVEIYKQALEMSPGSLDLVFSLANLYASVGEPELAAAEVETARQRWPGDTRLLARSVSLLIDLGQPGEALSTAARLTSLAPGEAESWLALGQAHQALGQFDRAEAAYRQATQQEPGSPETWLALGQFLSQRGEDEEAVVALNEASRVDRNAAAPHLALAEIQEREGRLRESRSEYLVAAGLDAADGQALVAVARLEQRAGQVEAAQEHLRRALVASPAEAGVYLERAEGFLLAGQVERARLELIAGTSEAAGTCLSFQNLGDFLAGRGDWAAAEAAYRQALARGGCTARAHVGLGNLYLAQAEPGRAIAEFARAAEARPGDPWGYIALAGAYLGQAQPEDAMATYERGLLRVPASALMRIGLSRSLIAQGALQRGLETAEEGVHLAPSNASTYIALGEAYKALGAFGEAERSYRQAAEVERLVSSPYLRLGDLYASSTLFEEAEAAFGRAIDLDPNDPSGYIALADFLQARGWAAEAISVYERGAEADRGQIGALLSLAQFYRRTGQVGAAEEALRRSLAAAPAETSLFRDPTQFETTTEAPPGAAQAYVALGDVYWLQGEWERSERAYQTAIEEAPGEAVGYIHLGEAYQAQGRQEEARARFSAALEVSPASSKAYLALGSLERARGNWEAAERAYQRAIEVAPGDVDSYLELGRTYQARGRQEEARAQFEAAVQAVPASARAHVAFGDWLGSQGDSKAAQEAYHKAIEVGAAEPEVYIALSRFYQARGLRGEALIQLKLAEEIAPASRSTYLALGDWYRLEEDWEAAGKAYRRSIEFGSDEVGGYLRLGYVYLSQGRPGDALAQFQAALGLEPSNAQAQVALGDWYRSNLDLQASAEVRAAALSEAAGFLKRADLQGEPDEFIEYLIAGVDDLRDGRVERAYERFEAAIRDEPDSLLPYLLMGQWYRAVVGLSESERAYRSAVEVAPGEVDGYLGLGRLYQDTDRPQQARAQFEKAVEVAPGSVPAYLALGDWHRAQGDWQAAERAYRTALELAPGDVDGYLSLGEMYQAQGLQKEALAQFEAAVVAGVAPETSVCGPGRLPSPPVRGDGYPVATSGRQLGTWQCQWDHRPWSLEPASAVDEGH